MPAGRGTNSDLETATRLATAMMLLSLFSRAGTFLLNAILLRFITPELLGLVQVRLLLLFYTIHTVSKDPYHKVFLDRSVWARHSVHRAISSLWSIALLGTFFTLVFSLAWSSSLLMEQPERGDYLPSVVVYGAAALLAVCGEPLLLLARYGGLTRLEVFSEAIAFLLQCVLTLLFVLALPDWGLLSFAIPQFIYSLIKVSVIICYFSRKREFSHLPIRTFRECFPPLPPSLSRPLLREVWSFVTYTILKQLLTNGEQYVMTVFATLSFAQQGIYSIVHNLGSIAARFIFKPLEESFAVYFTKSLPRGRSPSGIGEEELRAAREILLKLFRFVIIIGLVFATFSPAYSRLLLHLYGGAMLSSGDAPFLLQCYSLYVLLLALNGIAECFCFSVMGPAQVERYNWYMVMYSVAFVLLSVVCTNWFGVVGAILANCINMLARIVYSCSFIENYFSRVGPVLKKISPARIVILAFFLTLIITGISNRYFSPMELLPQVSHIAIGGACLLANGAVICYSDPWYLHTIISKLSHRVRQK